MKRKRFTKEQIITILKENEAGMRVQDLVRKYNVPEQSIYRWKSRFGGMEHLLPHYAHIESVHQTGARPQSSHGGDQSFQS